MDVVSALPAASVVWQPQPGAYALTIICKATYRVDAARLTLAAEQEPPLVADAFWSSDPRSSLRAATDLVPLKEYVDVVVSGHAFAPRGTSVAHLVARLVIGDVDKAIEIHGDRRQLGADATLHEGAEFEQMPLVYERAIGGPGTTNPVGLPREAELGAPLPNLLLRASTLVGPRGPVAGMPSFGPISPSWALRRQLLGSAASRTSPEDILSEVLPNDLDLAFFNHAPPDQQLPGLRDGEVVVLEHLHPVHAYVRFELPSVHPQLTVERAASRAATAGSRMRLDTVSIETDRALCSLTWRALVPLESPHEAGRVTVSFDTDDVRQAGHGTRIARPSSPAFRDDGRVRPDLPFRSAHDVVDWADRRPSAPPAPGATSLPEGGGATIEFAIPESIAHPPLVAMAPALAASGSPEDPPPAPRPTPPPPPWVSPVGPPKPSPVGSEVAPPETTWGSDVRHVPPPLTIGQMVAVTPQPSAVPAPAPAVLPAEPPRTERRGSQLDKNEVLQLLWYEPAVVPRARRVRAHRDLLDELEQRARATEIDDVTTGIDPMTVEDRRDVFEILARGAAISDDRWNADLVDAAIDRDKFVPSLVLAAGELSMTFDETAMLKALLTVASPFAPGDESLKVALQDAREFLAMPDLLAPASVIEAMSTRITEAYRKSKRGLAPGYLESHAERALLERRSYQKREAFGEAHLRGVLQVSAGSRPVPAYLPAVLAAKLPMFARFRVRVLAELHLQEDQIETHVAALRVLALGRVATLGAPAPEAKGR